tara:strand:+ start:720 stop:932 length:213 start_codon:yes stop_codon:yes gene_type:complete
MNESEIYRLQAADKLRIADLLDQNKKLKQHLAENNRPQEEPTVTYNFFGILVFIGLLGGGAYYYLFEVGF